MGPTRGLLHAAVKDTLDQQLLWSLAAHVSVTWLLGNKDTLEVTISRGTRDLELNLALEAVKLLVVLSKKQHVVGGSQSHQRLSLIVASVHATALGVQEGAGAVGRNVELAAEGGP